MEITHNGEKKEFDAPVSCVEIAKAFGVPLKNTIVAKTSSGLVDLARKIEKSTKIEFITFDSKEGKEVFWHSSSHVMAAAIKKLFPEAQLTLGPAIDEGFYYDFYNLKVGDNDLPRIEKEMKKIIEEDSKFIRKEVSKKEAIALFKDNKFKEEMLEEAEPPITVYETGDFVDICKGPHIPSTSHIKAIKLTKIAGAYWRGDSKREVLTRIYGVSFPSEAAMKEYTKFEEERSKHDHKKIGKALEIFETSAFSPGSPVFLPNGTIIYNELLNLAREMGRKYGYQEIITPIIAKSEVWKISGHYEKYKESMYWLNSSLEGDEKEEYGLKPMNCPFSTIAFKSKTRSYKELPIRFSDYGMLHRNELEGTLDGLFRTRMFEQTDVHIYVTEDQIEGEILKIFDMMKETFAIFKFTPIMTLGTRPKERIGKEEDWDKGETILKRILEKAGYKYTIKEGDGAFYGPKIDVYVLDFTGRPEAAYAMFTVQIDFNLAERFDVKYVGSDNKEHIPVVLHSSLIGAIGRFMGIILSNTGGDLPVWLSPKQVKVLTITERNNGYAKKVYERLLEHDIRVEFDDSNSTLDYKIRGTQLMKIPYVFVIGDKEETNKTVAVRGRDGKTKYGVDLDEFIKSLEKEIKERI
jgi:threonyl-tRNA synthetase